MLDQILYYLSWSCLVIGTFVVFSGTIGLLRMPDFFSRLHPAGMGDSLGLPLILIGLLLQTGLGLLSLKIVLIIFCSLITSATACHALAKAALHSSTVPEATVVKQKTTPKKKKPAAKAKTATKAKVETKAKTKAKTGSKKPSTKRPS